jgi:hypothetical protein
VIKILEVAIGVATVMLLLSMAVTVITQFILTVFNQRGQHLLRGVGDLVHQLDPSVDRNVSSKIAETLLKHPLLAGNLGRAGDVVHREELTTLLIDLASGSGSFGNIPLKGTAAAILKKNGIDDPTATLDAVRDFSMQLEEASPELATHVRHSMAILRAAESKYVAKINAWFDQTIDRVSQRFTTSTRAITIVIGLLVAFGLQVDTIELVDRLSLDDSLRAKVVAMAPAIEQTASTVQGVATQAPNGADAGDKQAIVGKSSPSASGTVTPPNTAGVSGSVASSAAPASTNPAGPVGGQTKGQARGQDQQIGDYYRQLSAAGLIAFPSAQSFSTATLLKKSPGVLLTAILLSLGAPFWYNTLASLLKLRSAVAQKDDQQRTWMARPWLGRESVSQSGLPSRAISTLWARSEYADSKATLCAGKLSLWSTTGHTPGSYCHSHKHRHACQCG